MKRTFVCNESMIITIPVGSLNDAREGQLMPDKFQCVYKDFYKVFVGNGKPKPLGAAQAIAGVFIVTLGLIFSDRWFFDWDIIWIYTLPSVVFLISGLLTYAAGRAPNIHVTKLSFSLNIISFLWSAVAICFCTFFMTHDGPWYRPYTVKLLTGINGLILALLILENLLTVFLIYWLSKAVCRQSFNTLPIVLLKQGD